MMRKFNVLATASILSLLINQAEAVKFDKKNSLSEDNNNLAHILYNNSKNLLEQAHENIKDDKLALEKEGDIKLQEAQQEQDNKLEALKKEYPQRKNSADIEYMKYRSKNLSLMKNNLSYSQDQRDSYAQWEKEADAAVGKEEMILWKEMTIRNNFEKQKKQIKEQYTLLSDLKTNFIDFQKAKTTFQKLFNDINSRKEENERIAKGKNPRLGVPTEEDILKTIKEANSFLKKFDDKATEILTKGLKSDKKEKSEEDVQSKQEPFVKIDNLEPDAEKPAAKPFAKIDPKSIDALFFQSKEAIDFNDEIDQKIRTILETLKVEDFPMEGTSPSLKSHVIRRSWDTYSHQYAQKKIVLFSGHTGMHSNTYETTQDPEYYMIDQCWYEVDPDAVLDVSNERHMRYIPTEQVDEIVADDARFLSDETIQFLARTLKPNGKIVFKPGFGRGWPIMNPSMRRGAEVDISDNGRSASAPYALCGEINRTPARKEAFILKALEKAIPSYTARGFREVAFDRRKGCFVLTK